MIKNYKNAIVTFFGGLGVIPILMAVFTDILDFGMAIVIAFAFFLLAAVLNGVIVVTEEYVMPMSMYRSQKNAIITFVAGLGIIVLLIAVFATLLSLDYAIVISYGFFLIAAVLYVMVEEKPEEKSVKEFNPSMDGTGVFCPSCGAQMKTKGIFCDNCGTRLE
jgi:hypothetical protein